MPIHMQKMMLALSLSVVGMIFTMDAAAASPANCSTHDALVEQLNERYGESRQSTGVTANGHIIEIFAHPETGTWTILLALPNGTSCLVSSGNAYKYLNEPAGKDV